ncbi:MAG: C40 family peptidase [Clostridium sp.]|nr:C40 family peptidase [Clostridium sp.]
MEKTIRLIICAIAAAAFAACGVSRPAANAYDEDVLAAEYECDSAEAFILAELQEQLMAMMPPAGSRIRMLLDEAYSWQGTPYKYGKSQKHKGTDCSGFIMEAFNNALGLKLPRNSAKQAEACRVIKRKDLQPGDLVFFHARGSRKVSHVGLYVGEDCMLHASSSHGVMVSRLSDPYWQRAFHSCGRILN